MIYESNQFFRKDKKTVLEIINMPDGSLIEKIKYNVNNLYLDL